MNILGLKGVLILLQPQVRDGVTPPGNLLLGFLLYFVITDICYTLHQLGCPLRYFLITVATLIREYFLMKISK